MKAALYATRFDFTCLGPRARQVCKAAGCPLCALELELEATRAQLKLALQVLETELEECGNCGEAPSDG